jgi:1-acyl-sn-glycerol-3-phosphate acyltransferase
MRDDLGPFASLLSAYTWIAIILLMIAWLPLLAVLRLVDRDPAYYLTGRWFRRLGAVMTHVNPFWRIEMSGPAPTDPRNPYVVVCNHQSMADIPLISRLPWEMKWLGKAELFSTPLIGWMLILAGDIPVDRNDQRSRALAIVKARDYLRRRCSVMFFPEGTRSRDGEVGPFSEGAFALAIKCSVPILVLALDGTANALPRKDWRFSRSGAIRLKILGQIETAQLTKAEAGQLAETVREMIVRQVLDWQGT